MCMCHKLGCALNIQNLYRGTRSYYNKHPSFSLALIFGLTVPAADMCSSHCVQFCVGVHAHKGSRAAMHSSALLTNPECGSVYSLMACIIIMSGWSGFHCSFLAGPQSISMVLLR